VTSAAIVLAILLKPRAQVQVFLLKKWKDAQAMQDQNRTRIKRVRRMGADQRKSA
jgi:hypothetical protein